MNIARGIRICFPSSRMPTRTEYCELSSLLEFKSHNSSLLNFYPLTSCKHSPQLIKIATRVNTPRLASQTRKGIGPP